MRKLHPLAPHCNSALFYQWKCNHFGVPLAKSRILYKGAVFSEKCENKRISNSLAKKSISKKIPKFRVHGPSRLARHKELWPPGRGPGRGGRRPLQPLFSLLLHGIRSREFGRGWRPPLHSNNHGVYRNRSPGQSW